MDGTKVDGKTVAEHIVDFLQRRKVEHVFGLCGHTNIAVLAALAESPIDFITVRHEQIASHAADAYARVTGRASVVLSHLSPGSHELRHRCCQRRARLHPDGCDRGRHPDPLLRQASPPGGQPPRRRRPVGNLPPLRQTRMAGGPCGPDGGDPRKGISPCGIRAAGPCVWSTSRWTYSRKVIPSDTFDRIAGNTKSLVKPSIDDETARAIVEEAGAGRMPLSPTSAAESCWRRRATSCAILPTTWACRSPIP